MNFETERLILRPLEIKDVDDFYEMNNNPNVNRYLRNPLLNKLDVENYINKIREEYVNNGIGRFGVILKENNKLIGFSGLKFRANEENGHANFHVIGFRFSEDYWRKGYAKEAALAWLEYGFKKMKLKEIHACAETENIPSNNLLKQLGFQFENSYTINNTLHNWYILENNYES